MRCTCINLKLLVCFIVDRGGKIITMTKISDIFSFIDSFAPFDTAMDFDNVGILVGDNNAEISRCLVALDITKDVITEAKKLGAVLIISHHPVIFEPIKALSITSVPYMLAQSGISAICAHTNLDMASFGVNSCLANALNLKNLEALSYYDSKRGPLPMGFLGSLGRDFTCEEFAEFVKNSLECTGVRFTDFWKRIRKVAVCSGAGGDLINMAINKNADAFVTGEIKHHEVLLAVQNEVCLVEVGHFKSEDVVILPLIKKLAERFKDVEFIKSKICKDAIKYMV